MPISLYEIRQKYPEYNDMSDRQIADKLHAAHYKDIPKNEFYTKVGLQPTRKASTKEFLGALVNPETLPAEAEYTVPQSLGMGAWNKFGETGRGLLQLLGIDQENNALEQQAFDKAIKRSAETNPVATITGGLLGSIGETVALGGAGKAAQFAGGIPAFAALGGAQYTRPGESKLANTALNAGLGIAGKAIPQVLGGAKNLGAKGLERLGVPADLAQSISGTGVAGLTGAGAASLANTAFDTDIDPLAAGLGVGGLYAGGKAGYQTLKSTASRILDKSKEKAAKTILKTEGTSDAYQKQLAENVKKRTASAKEAGLEKTGLLPSEATGSPTIAQAEAEYGKTPAAKGKLEEWWRGKGGRVDEENGVVDKFFNLLGVKKDGVPPDTARQIRDTAIKIVEDQKEYRKKAASKIYKKAYENSISKKTSNTLLKDDVISEAAADLEKNAAYRQASKGMGKLGIERWDLVKRKIDDKIASAVRSGDNNLARILTDSKNKLVKALDKASPMYKKARGVYASESEVLEELTSTNLGKLYKLKDADLPRVSNMLFNTAEIDPKTLELIRGNLFKENPKIFYQAIAQNMQSKMDTMARSATGRNLPALYNAVFKDKKTASMYKDMLKRDPKALRRFEAIQEAFKDISSDFTPKAAVRLEKTGMLNPRDFLKNIKDMLFRSDRADKAAIDFITDPKWAKSADKIINMKPGPQRDIALFNYLTKISKSNLGTAAKGIQEPLRKGLNEQD